MTYTSDVIKSAIAVGYKADLNSGKKSVRMYICHACKEIAMMKFRQGGLRYNACKCGYRKKF
jgi:hypothetical protein